ncbi:glycosyl transferase family 90 [Paracoccus tegillarcae]|nr:glycosyl transferase family 90 [Paracoccus tegillarcae]
MNGIPALHWLKGALADDIAYSKLVGRPPLQQWAAEATVFTDMESIRHINMPVIEGFREFAFLDQHFPDAIFLLNTRRVDDWINSRYVHLGGSYARAFARNLDVGLADLADIWREDWRAHHTACRSHFGTRAEFIEIDIDHATPEDYRTALSPWFDLPKIPDLPDDKRLDRRKSYAVQLAETLAAPQPGDGITTDQREAVAGVLARFASPQQIQRHDQAGDAVQRHIVRFDAARAQLHDAKGKRLAIRRGGDGRYYADPLSKGLLLIAATANDISGVTDQGVYDLDMRDACRIGTGPRLRSAGPVIAPSRRPGAENVFLWPMPRYHRLGNNAFLGPDPNAATPLDQRQDRAVWQGGLTGYLRGQNGPNLNQPAGSAVDQVLKSAPGSAQGEAAHQALRRANRIAFVRDWRKTEGVDVRLYPDPRAKQALRKAGMGNLITDGATQDHLHTHRYVICLGGAPLAEEFLPALNAGAVVLKEEDGWQFYNSCLLHAWEHYIPLEYGAGDLADKLDWARANPDACQTMTERARRVCAALADPAGRKGHLELVLEAYRAAKGQSVNG